VLAEQTEVIDKALWSVLKTIEEKVSLSSRLARQAQERGNTQLAQHLRGQSVEAEENARRVRHLLLHPSEEEQQVEPST
jgi:hypothetical protein